MYSNVFGRGAIFSDFVSYNLLMPSGLLHPNVSDQRKKKKKKKGGGVGVSG